METQYFKHPGAFVAPYSIVVGNPAKHVGWMSEYGIKISFNKNNIAVCQGKQAGYLLEDNQVKRIK